MRFLTFFFPLAFLCVWHTLPAQNFLADSFPSGNLHPDWSGDTALFKINQTGQLQLSDPDPGSSNTAYISRPASVSLEDTTWWTCWLRLDFSPSSSNYARWYLSASASGLAGFQEGYFIQTGGVSGDLDAVELYRQDGPFSDKTLLLSATPGALGGDTALVRLRIQRDPLGYWTLWTDYSGGDNWLVAGTVFDPTYPAGAWTGWVCQYTSTRAEDFFFDDLHLGPLYQDLDPPQLLEIEQVDSTRLLAIFDEAVTGGQFSLDPGPGMPETLVYSADTVFLTWQTPFQPQVSYTLTITGIADLAGNIAGSQQGVFVFVPVIAPQPFEVVFSEIFPDPSPPVALPEVEWVELFNRTDRPINLQGWTLRDPSGQAVFPAAALDPGQYLILCDQTDAAALASWGSVLGLADFPSLNNSGDTLTLCDATGQLIDFAIYAPADYGNSGKEEGGWSLEKSFPNRPCLVGGSWAPSTSPAGGTPGMGSGLADWTPDSTGPQPLEILPETDTSIRVRFDEWLGPDISAQTFQWLDLAQTIDLRVEGDRVWLVRSSPMEAGYLYSLGVFPGVPDCLGNLSRQADTLAAAFPRDPETGDLSISEVLFNPYSGGSDYVELYNRSQWVLSLDQVLVADTLQAVRASGLFLPGDYMALTEDTADIRSRYLVARPENLVQAGLPSWPDEEGLVYLYRISGGQVIFLDSLRYSAEWHNPFLADPEGVSLERLDLEAPTGLRANWQSASAQSGFGTPTGPNSQKWVLGQEGDPMFSLPYEAFSPDGDGFQDYLLFVWDLGEPGWQLSLSVWDYSGRPVRYIADGELVAPQGAFQWSGELPSGDQAPEGIYYLLVEGVHPSGGRLRKKLACAVSYLK